MSRARRGESKSLLLQFPFNALFRLNALGIERGVNVTTGPPFVRSSFDHEGAFSAGHGRADPSSLRPAEDHGARLAQAIPIDFPLKSSRGSPDFIFMLTKDDKTIPDALERLNETLECGIAHIGFKDVGVPFESLATLAQAIRAAGATVYLEVVSLDAGSEKRSAEAAVELGVDVLMGGTRPEVVLPIIRKTAIRYYPFPGAISGHPSVLDGPIAAIVESARRLASMPGIHGLDLLAYRFDGDTSRLIREVREAAAPKPVVVAGSIDRAERIQAIVSSEVAGFTIGTAAFAGAFNPDSKRLADQLRAIQGILSHCIIRA
jgi:4-hydroxythreonine-4-phosphate dehydrogenase